MVSEHGRAALTQGRGTCKTGVSQAPASHNLLGPWLVSRLHQLKDINSLSSLVKGDTNTFEVVCASISFGIYNIYKVRYLNISMCAMVMLVLVLVMMVVAMGALSGKNLL